MKKLFLLILALALTLSLAACSGNSGSSGNNNTGIPPAGTTDNAATDNNGGSGDVTASMTPSVTLPDGWAYTNGAKTEASYTGSDPDKAGSSISLGSDMLPDNVTGPAGFLNDPLCSYGPGVLKNYFDGGTIGPVLPATVNGMEAAQFTATSDSTKIWVLAVCKSGYAYVITCKKGTPLDGADADFQSMIDSFTLQ